METPTPHSSNTRGVIPGLLPVEQDGCDILDSKGHWVAEADSPEVAGIIERAVNAFDSLNQEIRGLKAVCHAYDVVINTLPKDELVRFANLTPPEFLKSLRLQDK